MKNKKTNAIILHGYEGSPDANWFPWLAGELKKHDIETLIPQLPLGEEQTKEKWVEAILEHKDEIGENTIMIGHSLGAATLLSLLPELDIPVKATYFIGGYGKSFETIHGKAADVCFPFVEQVRWKKIRKKAGQMSVVFSTNDHFVPLEESVYLGSMLQAPMQVIADAGHFQLMDGYDQFPWLLEDILKTVYVQYEEFQKMDMRIGQIKEVEPVEGSDKLLRFQIDFGETDLRQIVSGIRGYVTEYETLINKKVLYIINLAPRMIMGVESRGMLMAIGDEQTPLAFLVTDGEVSPGSKVR
jgi:methionine--tRNA ligase beta chain